MDNIEQQKPAVYLHPSRDLLLDTAVQVISTLVVNLLELSSGVIYDRVRER